MTNNPCHFQILKPTIISFLAQSKFLTIQFLPYSLSLFCVNNLLFLSILKHGVLEFKFFFMLSFTYFPNLVSLLCFLCWLWILYSHRIDIELLTCTLSKEHRMNFYASLIDKFVPAIVIIANLNLKLLAQCHFKLLMTWFEEK